MAKKWGNRFIKYIVLLLFWLVLSGTFDARVLITGLFAAAVVYLPLNIHSRNLNPVMFLSVIIIIFFGFSELS